MVINANNSMIVGDHNILTGNNCQVTGDHNKIKGNNNQVTGNHNTVRGNNNHITGKNNNELGSNNVVDEGRSVSVKYNRGRTIVNAFNGSSLSSVVIDGVSEGRVKSNSQISTGTIVGGMYQNNSKPKKKKKEDPVFIEVPTEQEATEQDKPLPEPNEDGRPECRICMSNHPICVIMPCMHQCICCACARILAADGTKEVGQVECPMCKTGVEKIKRVFV